MDDKIIIKKINNFINQETGEIIPIETIIKNTNIDKDFNKIWLEDKFANVIGSLTKKENQVFLYLVKNKNSKNEINITQLEVMNKLNISRGTTSTAFKKLQDGDIIKQKKKGLYMFNPDLIFKGSYTKRCYHRTEYKHNNKNILQEKINNFIKKENIKFNKLTYEDKIIYIKNFEDYLDEEMLKETLILINTLGDMLKKEQKNNNTQASAVILESLNATLDSFFKNHLVLILQNIKKEELKN